VVKAVASAVERQGAADRVIISSFDVGVVSLVRRTTSLPTGLLFHARQRRPLREAWLAPIIRPHAVHPDRKLVDEAAMRSWRRSGYRVNVWTVDDPAEVRRLTRLGVDALISNDPAAARAAMEES
jgi:glycerophosphoryl diester phosphodiesterase